MLLFIVLWFDVYPLAHVHIYGQSIEASNNRFWFYWPVALLIFVILLLLFVCCWRCKPGEVANENTEAECILNNKRKEKEFYTVSLNSSVGEPQKDDTNSVQIEEITPAKAEKLFPRCSVKRKPEKLCLQERNVSDVSKRQTVTLSPRELFFQDLLNEENKSDSSVTFADNQPLEEAVLSALNKTTSASEQEFFIANISPCAQNYKNNIFMYVNVEEEPTLKVKNAD